MPSTLQHVSGLSPVFLGDLSIVQFSTGRVQVRMEGGDHSALIDACVHWGDINRGGDPQLWHEVLEFFAAQPSDCAAQVHSVIMAMTSSIA